MLFDLQSGKRRRVVQVVYGFLAASFLIGFVFFGVGSGGIGSLSDVLGIGNGSSSGTSSSAFDTEISRAQDLVAKNPKDAGALARLAKYQYLKGHAELSSDSSGHVVVSGTAQTDFGSAVDSWEKYLKLVGQKPDPGTAQQVVYAYYYLGDFAGAARTQELIAKAAPSGNSLGTLAIYLYAAGKLPEGDAAAKQALAKTPASQRKTVSQQLDQIRSAAQKFLKQQKQQAQAGASGASTTPLQNPFGGLGAPAPGG